jgi:hypothetical protein
VRVASRSVQKHIEQKLVILAGLLFFLVLTLLTQAQADRGEKSDWYYVPVQRENWQAMTDLIAKGNLKSAMDRVDTMKSAERAVEKSEGDLAEAVVLIRMGVVALGMELLLDIIEKYPGTELQTAALDEFERAARDNPYDLERATALFSQLRVTRGPAAIQDMVGFHTMISNANRKFLPWAKANRKAINSESEWLIKYQYWKTIEKYKSGNRDEAFKELGALRSRLDKPSIFRWELDLNRARLLFELKRYSEADTLYQEISQPDRRYGMVLLERAWTLFSRREFEGAAGLLAAMKSPYFDVSTTPERYLLEMLIYREQCHFKYIKPVVAQFRQFYAPTIKQIRKGTPLNEIKALMSAVLLGTDYIFRAQYIQQLRSDLVAVEKMQNDTIIARAKKIETFHRRKLEYEAREDLKRKADFILLAEEQMRLIEYVAGLGEIRNSRKPSSLEVEEKPVDWKLKEKELSWPLRNEYWWDELPLLKVNIPYQCEGFQK